MEGLYRYFRINIKRILRLLPVIVAGTALLCVCALVGIYAFARSNSSDHTKLKVGIVGNLENSYLEYGITALQSLDATSCTIELVNVSEAEAVSMTKRGELTAYMKVPEDFVDSVRYGENDISIDYVCGEGDAGLVGTVMEEIVDSFSEYVTGSQSVIYASQSVNKSVNGYRRLSKEQLVDINTICINSVLNREKFCKVRFLGVSYNLSMAAYYLCGIFVVFLLLSGINCCMYFTGRSREFQRISIAKGGKIWQQVLGEYLPFLIVSLCITVCVWCFLSFAVSSEVLYIDEWSDNAIVMLWKMFVHIIPVVVFITIVQMFLYELVDNLIAGILLQFIVSICMGYVSGCFYPESYFTDSIRSISSFLPPKMAVRYMASYFSDNDNLFNSMGMLLYSVICAVMIYRIRRRRINQS